MYLQGETIKRVKTFQYMRSTMAHDNGMRKSSAECIACGRTGRECMECCVTERSTSISHVRLQGIGKIVQLYGQIH